MLFSTFSSVRGEAQRVARDSMVSSFSCEIDFVEGTLSAEFNMATRQDASGIDSYRLGRRWCGGTSGLESTTAVVEVP
jgi:hypothetical protein